MIILLDTMRIVKIYHNYADNFHSYTFSVIHSNKYVTYSE